MQHPEVLREVSLVSFCDDDGDNDGDDDEVGLVSFAHIISAMIMIQPEANPSPRLEYTKNKNI